jgi:penicillin amidase
MVFLRKLALFSTELLRANPMKFFWKLLSLVIPVAIFLVFFLTPLGTIFLYRVNPHYPKNNTQTVRLNNLNEPVDVYFDDYGVPHIEGKNVEDTIRATGFVHGRYRFFQLDILRRLASGRLAALLGNQPALGSTTVEVDLAMRGWGFIEKTKVDLDALPELDRRLLLAMTDGIQQSLEQYRPVEYDILQVEPEPWQLSDTLLVSLLQAWSISHNWEQEVVRLSLALNLGLELADKIYPNEPPFETRQTIKPKSDKVQLPAKIPQELLSIFPSKAKATPQRSDSDELYSVIGDLMQLRPSASNAWVVNKTRSKSGMPIVANDMHLTHSLPSILFLQHIKAPGVDAIGAALPGLPFVVSGHNGQVAWGVTSAVADVVDLIIEKEDPNNPGFVLNENKKCSLVKTKETIAVRGERPKEFVIRRSCHGPLLNDMYPKLLPKDAPMVSIRWELPNVQESFGNFLRANQAKTLDDLRTHLMKLPSPIQNIMGADTDGNIAFFSTGSVPVRKQHRGTFPTPGWIGKYEWQGFASIDQMPHIKNPTEGYIINTNNQVVSPRSHQPLFQIDSATSFRYERAEQRLQELNKHDSQSMQDIQLDHVLIRAQKIMPHLLKDLIAMKNPTEVEKQILIQMQNWDFSSPTDSVAMSIFMAIYREAIIAALADKLPQRGLHMFLKQRYSNVIVDTWFYDELHPVWDDLRTPEKEKRADTLIKSFKNAQEYLTGQLGPDWQRWQWGQLHYIQLQHLFGKKSLLSFMNLKRTPLAGGLDSVWKAHFNLSDHNNPYKTVAGATYRMVVDLANFDEGRFTLDTGMSGWANSPHYGDLFDKWKKGELVKMHYNWDDIRTQFADRKMTLMTQ